MDRRLIFCYAVYNDAGLLRKSFESVKPYADMIVVVEGRFKGFPTDEPHSTDGTIEICDEETGYLYCSSGLPQHRQRDIYLIGKPGDFYFIIDADEILAGDFDKDWVFESGYDSVCLWVHDTVRGQACLSPKIYRHVEGIHHNPGNLLYDGKNRCMTSPPYSCGKTYMFRLDHLTALRGEERQVQKDRYYKSLG